MKPTENKPGYFQRFQNFAMIRMAPGVVIEKDSLTYWRVRILFAIIVTGLLIGLFALVPSVALVIKKKLWGLLLVDLVVWPVGISILFSRRLKYEIRAAIALISFYLLGLAIIISVGPLSGGPMWLFAFAVLVGVLLGSKAAIMALTVNGITLTITGWLINAGRLAYQCRDIWPYISVFQHHGSYVSCSCKFHGFEHDCCDICSSIGKRSYLDP